MKLELKHLAPYLPYGLKVMLGANKRDLTALSWDSPFCFVTAYVGARERQMAVLDNIKPILRPLSDLTKEIAHNSEKFVPMEALSEMTFDYLGIEAGCNDYYYVYSKTEGDHWRQLTHDDIWAQPAFVMAHLFEWHFDVFGLIDAGLAIDINTLNK